MQQVSVAITKESEPVLFGLGFEGAFSFSGPGKILRACCMAILLHLNIDYSHIPEHAYYEKSLRGGVLAQYWEYFQEKRLAMDVYNPDTAFVDGLHGILLAWLTDQLRKKNNTSLAEDVERLRDVKPEHKKLLELICEGHKLYGIFFTEADGHLAVELIKGSREKSAILPVVLHFQGDSVRVLYHKFLNTPPELLGFPFLMDLNDNLAWLMASAQQAAMPAEEPANQSLNLAKYNVTAVLCNFLCDVLPQGVPSQCLQQHTELTEVINAFEALQSISGERLAYAEDLKEVAALPLRPHEVLNCASFPPEDRVQLNCGHVFHLHCLKAEVSAQWSRVSRTEKPVLYCPAHAVPLADSIIQRVDPLICMRLQQARRDFRNARVKRKS